MKNIALQILSVLFCLVGLTACSDHDSTPDSKTFVLVHGAWQAPYAWQYVRDQLQQNGQKVIVVELPGHGSDKTPTATLTMDAYRDKIITAINTVTEKVILVGHSMGGMAVTATAEKIPDRIDKLVYVGAFLPANGQSLQQLASTDSTSLLGPATVPAGDPLAIGLKTESLVSIFIQDGSDVVKKLVVDNYQPEPAIPLTNPVTVTAANFGRVNKYYIHTLQDHAVGYNLQKRMVAAAGIKNTFSLNTGHCPFLSTPSDVTNLLLTIAQ